ADSARLQGIYHLTAAGETSWYGFACRIRELMDVVCNIQSIPTHEYPTPARRPAYSVLDNTKLEETFGLKMPEWQTSLKLCMEDRSH
ncbi:MAG: NAD(P)-dependent oxidoreductase, partial [Candidatus Thiodiazotropha sp. (ex Cardiolucina cf. quadrata)]|nr:NAD(P)-dependent oxidoreductase [Candidatus Thiodiazotropha sp. (ex Cardiolucina cf. quadrata)]